MQYLQLFCSVGIVFPGDQTLKNGKREAVNGDDQVLLSTIRRYAEFFADPCELSYRNLGTEPEIKALASVICARRVKMLTPEWSSAFTKLYGIDQTSIISQVEELWSQYQNFLKKKNKGSFNNEKDEATERMNSKIMSLHKKRAVSMVSLSFREKRDAKTIAKPEKSTSRDPERNFSSRLVQ